MSGGARRVLACAWALAAPALVACGDDGGTGGAGTGGQRHGDDGQRHQHLDQRETALPHWRLHGVNWLSPLRSSAIRQPTSAASGASTRRRVRARAAAAIKPTRAGTTPAWTAGLARSSFTFEAPDGAALQCRESSAFGSPRSLKELDDSVHRG